jgi:hypothetical protein
MAYYRLNEKTTTRDLYHAMTRVMPGHDYWIFRGMGKDYPIIEIVPDPDPGHLLLLQLLIPGAVSELT